MRSIDSRQCIPRSRFSTDNQVLTGTESGMLQRSGMHNSSPMINVSPQPLHKSSCRSDRLAAIAPEDGTPTG